MHTIKDQVLDLALDNKTIKIIKSTIYSNGATTVPSTKNSTIDGFNLKEKFSQIDASKVEKFNAKNTWTNPGGWQSWAPGFEVGPKEKRPALKNIAVTQWNDYLTLPRTDEEFYSKKYILGHFIMYFRCENTYLFIASTGNTKELLPPVQYVVNRKTQNIQVQIYDCGKTWNKDEKEAELVYFIADSFFEAKDVIKKLYSDKEYCGEKCASRFDSLSFLTEVPGGWESWYNHYANIDEKIILEDLKSLDETDNIISMMYLKENKAPVFQIDDGWEVTVGAWQIREDRFPNGLKSISEKIEAKNMIPGLWLAPFLLDLRAPLYKNHPDWVLRDSMGIPVSAGFNPIWGAKKGEYQPRKDGTFYCLDLSNDEVVQYLDNLIETAINEWGIRYLKLDFLYAGMLYGKFKNGGSAYQWYDRAVKVLTKRKQNKEGKPVAYLGCGMPVEHSFQDFPLSRIGCDTKEAWDDSLMKMIQWNGRTSAYLNVKDTLGRAMWNKGVYLNDPDVVFVRNNNCTLTREEKLIVATVDILFGNQIMYSDDPAISSGPEEVELAKEIAEIAAKFKGEEFSCVPTDVDVYAIESRSGKYKGLIDLNKRKISWNEAK